MAQEKLDWIQGNTLELVIPMQLVTFDEGSRDAEDYTPPAESNITVILKSLVKEYEYTDSDITIVDNTIRIKDDGELAVGLYSVIILIEEPSGTKYRSNMKNIIEIHDDNEATLEQSSSMPEYVSGSIIDANVLILVGEDGDEE